MKTSMEAKTSKSKTLVRYSCEEIYDRMSNGLCIFCEDLDTPGHHDLKHKGVKILVTEGDDQPIVTESEPIIEESLVESDEFVTKTMMKPDAVSVLLEGFTSDLQIADAAGQKEDQNKSEAEENMRFFVGNKIEHVVGKHTQKAVRVWEPGGLPTEAAQLYLPEKRQSLWLSAATSEKMAERVWEPGELSAKEIQRHWTEKLHNQDDVLQLTPKLNMTELGFRSKMDNELKLFVGMGFHSMRSEAAVGIYLRLLRNFKLLTIRNVLEIKRLREQVPLRVMSTEKHGKYLKAWKLKFKSKNLFGARANKKRPLDPGITKILNPLVCLGSQNKKCEAELEVYMHHSSTTHNLCVMYHCPEMEFSEFKNLHELGLKRNPELVSPLVKDTQDRIVNAWFKTRACSGFDLASWRGLEIYGCKYNKNMLLLAKDLYRVWDRGGVLGTHLCWKLFTRSSITSTPQISHVITATDENILVNKICHQGYCFLMFVVQDHITEALYSHFLACAILLVSYSNLQPLLVSYSCHGIIYLDSSEENMGFAITRRWLSVVHLLCSMGIHLWTTILWNRKTRKKEDESRLSWDGLLIRYKELKYFMQKICEDLIQAGYEWLISKYSRHKENTLNELAATDVRVRLLWETITNVTVALLSECGITNNFTEYLNWSQQGMQDHTSFNQFLFGTEMFQVKHKWRYKPFSIVSELGLKDEAAQTSLYKSVYDSMMQGLVSFKSNKWNGIGKVVVGARSEDVLSCSTTGQARDEELSVHVEVKRTIEMSQVLLIVTNCYADSTSYGEAFYISFQSYKLLRAMGQEDRNLLKVVKSHKNAVTRCFVQWKEHPPDQVFMLSSLRTRMF